jgi:hypothetical protein
MIHPSMRATTTARFFAFFAMTFTVPTHHPACQSTSPFMTNYTHDDDGEQPATRPTTTTTTPWTRPATRRASPTSLTASIEMPATDTGGPRLCRLRQNCLPDIFYARPAREFFSEKSRTRRAPAWDGRMYRGS